MQLGSNCNACGITKKSRNQLRFDPNTFMGYCDNPFTCGGGHPNSPANLMSRGTQVDLVSYEEAEAFYKKQLETKFASPELVEEFFKLIKKPTGVRISDPTLAQFLVRLKTDLELDDYSKVIRYCIEFTRERYGKLVEPISVNREAVEEYNEREAVLKRDSLPANEPEDEEITI